MQFSYGEQRDMGIKQIYDLAVRVSVLDFQELLKNRLEKGFQHFFLDLMKEPETRSPDYDPALSQGWILKGGLLTVHENCEANQLMDFLESKLQHHAWFETRQQKMQRLARGEHIDLPTLPAGFKAYRESYKTLGKYGPNAAIDVIAFIENPDGSLSEKVIVRPHDKKYAFVGGMIEQKEATLGRCFDEMLEEFYSNDLFVRDSGTEFLAGRKSLPEVLAAFEEVLRQKEFSTLTPVFAEILSAAQSGTHFSDCLERFCIQLLSYTNRAIPQANGKEHTHRMEDLEHLFVRFRCLLYKQMCPAQYALFCDFLHTHLVEMPLTTNESDPRNTNEAYMVTMPHWLYVSYDDMASLERDCAIKPKGGDDAVSTHIVPLEKLYEQSMYAAHGRINLEALAQLLKKRPDLLASPILQAQLRKIEESVIARERASLELYRASSAASGQLLSASSVSLRTNLPSIVPTRTGEQLSTYGLCASAHSSLSTESTPDEPCSSPKAGGTYCS